MDKPGVRQVPEGSGEQGKWRKLVAKSSVVPQRLSRLRIDDNDDDCPIWEFSYGKFGVLSPREASCDRVAPCDPRCILMFQCFDNPLKSEIDYRACNMRV